MRYQAFVEYLPMSNLFDRRSSHSDRRRSLIHPIRPHHNHTSHAICLEKFIQVLLHNETSAARSVTHEKPFAISYDDPGMKNIEVLACGHKENQITGIIIRDGKRLLMRHAS